jgi:tetratricopeptide (TPR) repeat protein
VEPLTPKKLQSAPVPVPPKNVWYFAATHPGPDAYAYEDPIFGHGIFSYFLLRGLESDDARIPNQRIVTATSLSNYVETWVQKATTSPNDNVPRQKPLSLLGVALGSRIADLSLPGPKFDDSRPLNTLVVPSNRLGKMRRQAKPAKRPASDPAPLPVDPGPDMNRRIALEDQGEDILLRYLEGDEVPQRVEDFRRCADIYAEALQLQPGSPYLEARRVFCRARALVFDKRYDAAISLFERAIRLDPSAAYSYNGLGIAYLENGSYEIARAAFQDAIERAPKWAYPRHNLALVHTQTGNYDAAIAVYREAIERAPDYSYLPYNLGLVYQRINRYSDAEAAYLQAIKNAGLHPPGRCEPYVALGSLKASAKKWKAAEQYYRQALTIPAGELTLRTARHNLAALLARTVARRPEAEDLWRRNGDYAPSELMLAESLAGRGQTADAIQLCRRILAAAPEHLSARLLLATELQKAGSQADAIHELRIALSMQPRNPATLETLAESLQGSGREGDAARLLRTVLDYGESGDSEFRSRMLKAVKRLEEKR